MLHGLRTGGRGPADPAHGRDDLLDRKSTRLNSSHSQISYAVFCLKKKKEHYSRIAHTHHLLVQSECELHSLVFALCHLWCGSLRPAVFYASVLSAFISSRLRAVIR